MNERSTDEDFLRWLGATIVGVACIAFFVAVAFGDVAIRNAGGVVLSGTPQLVGTAQSRLDYYLHNWAGSNDEMVCGYNSATISFTPGPTTGHKLAPGEGQHVCVFADMPVYCITVGGGAAVAFLDESRMVTPTPTPP